MTDELGETLAASRAQGALHPHALNTGAARYERGRELGRGGMGRVVEAVDLQFQRRVALKELRAGADAERFALEALITGNLEHPAIPAVFERGVSSDGAPFYAMQKVRGRTLEQAWAEARTLEARLQWLPAVARVAEALAYAHERGVVHRDVKPANVVVGPHGEVVLLDWGVARVRGFVAGSGERATEPGAGASLTVDGALVGTPAFMAPEQAAGRTEALDERTDVFALGALLYQLLSGRLPYEAETLEHTLLLARDGKVRPVLEWERRAPAPLVAVCERAMRPNQAERYRNAHEFVAALREVEGRALLEQTPHVVRVLVAAVPVVVGVVSVAFAVALTSISGSLQHFTVQGSVAIALTLLGLTLSVAEWRTRGRLHLSGLALAFALATAFGGLAMVGSGLVVTMGLAEAAPPQELRTLLLVGMRESFGGLTFGAALAAVQVLVWAVARRAAADNG